MSQPVPAPTDHIAADCSSTEVWSRALGLDLVAAQGMQEVTRRRVRIIGTTEPGELTAEFDHIVLADASAPSTPRAQ